MALVFVEFVLGTLRLPPALNAATAGVGNFADSAKEQRLTGNPTGTYMITKWILKRTQQHHVILELLGLRCAARLHQWFQC